MTRNDTVVIQYVRFMLLNSFYKTLLPTFKRTTPEPRAFEI